jgi:hypothetical protein
MRVDRVTALISIDREPIDVAGLTPPLGHSR